MYYSCLQPGIVAQERCQDGLNGEDKIDDWDDPILCLLVRFVGLP
jgi:hypothetical protein